jgi:hypothetical protein
LKLLELSPASKRRFMSGPSLSELRARLAAANERLFAAREDAEQAVAELKSSDPSSPEWRRMLATVGEAAGRIVRIEGGKSPEGRTIRGELPTLLEQIKQVEYETAWAELGDALAAIENEVAASFTPDLASRISAFGYKRIDFRVEIDGSGTVIVHTAKRGVRSRASSTGTRRSRSGQGSPGRRGAPWTNGTETLPNAKAVVEAYGHLDRAAVASGDALGWRAHKVAYGRDATIIARRLGWRQA